MSPTKQAARLPEWIPTSADGTDWNFVSYKGKVLGSVSRCDELDGFANWIPAYLSDKFCCNSMRQHRRMDVAACRVETVLHCTECKLACLVPVSN